IKVKELVEPFQGSGYMGNCVYIVVESLRDSMNNEQGLTICDFRSEYLLRHSKLLVLCSDIASSFIIYRFFSTRPSGRSSHHSDASRKVSPLTSYVLRLVI
ncbi:MAG: hypothetical protein KAH15_05470, partial [Candidatus Marinimicrobia bacterium]|nr:hypothetical protein [Candidatus Neomarinimicrobiota bacterium]